MIGAINIGVQVDQKSFRDLVKDLKKMKKVIGSTNMQLYRATKFKQYTVDLVKRGDADIKPISSATASLTGGHNPEFLTGKLLSKMEVKPSGNNAAEVGYFPSSELVSGKKITWTQLAELQHTGYRIPLFGEKGKRVRAWLAMQGLGDISKGPSSPNKKWIVVPARPFMLNSLYRYIIQGEDVKAVDEFIQKLINSPVGE